LDATTVGQRVYLVRLACGDGVRKAMPMREFADLLSQQGDAFYASRISDIENSISKPTIDEIDVIARVDPLKRGREWLGWGDSGGNVIADPPPKPITNPPQIPIITRGKPANLPMAPPRKPGKRNRGDRSAMVG
jgi:hypothetical protein